MLENKEKRVDVDWMLFVDGSGYKDYRPKWRNKLVIEERVLGDGKLYYMLEGHPCCPVRVERCTIVVDK